MKFNSSPVNDVALDDVSPREEFEGIFGRFYQSVAISREAGTFAEFSQSVGIARAENVFIIFDQVVLLRSVTPSGEFVCFYQDVQKTVDEQNFITLNQKVIT